MSPSNWARVRIVPQCIRRPTAATNSPDPLLAVPALPSSTFCRFPLLCHFNLQLPPRLEQQSRHRAVSSFVLLSQPLYACWCCSLHPEQVKPRGCEASSEASAALRFVPFLGASNTDTTSQTRAVAEPFPQRRSGSGSRANQS